MILQNLKAWWTAGKMKSSFSKSDQIDEATLVNQRAKSFVVLPAAIPVGRISPCAPPD